MKNKFKFIPTLIILLAMITTGLNGIIFSQNTYAVGDVSQGDIVGDYILDGDDLICDDGEDVYIPDASLPSAYCLRDDYMIYTNNQNPFGLCWAYASAMSLGTTLEKNTGEYYDFSEAYISISLAANGLFSHTVGSGGNFSYFNTAAIGYGLVLESDFAQEDMYNVSNENAKEYYNYYSQFASNDYLNSVSAVYFKTKSDDASRQAMKQHILDNGSIVASVYWASYSSKTVDGKTVYYKPVDKNNTDSGHAISIIGWDDNFSDGNTTGAWVTLNSWGDTSANDGVFYLMYADNDYMGSFWGYKYQEDSSDAFLNTTLKTTGSSAENGYYQTSLKGAYYRPYTTSTNPTKQRNIFFAKNVNLEYDYNISSGAKINEIEILRNNVVVTNDFNLSWTSNTINISGNNVDLGSYKAIMYYEYNGSTYEHLSNFFVVDGNEFEYVSTSVGGGLIVGNDINGSTQLVNNYNNQQNDIVLSVSNASAYVTLYFYRATYSQMTFSSDLSLSYIRSATQSSDRRRYTISLSYTIDEDEASYPLEFTSYLGFVKTINVHLILRNSSEVMSRIGYNTNGGQNDEDNLKRVILSKSGTPTIINSATKTGYGFDGWYLDANFTKPLESNGDGTYNLYYSQIKEVTNPTAYAKNNIPSELRCIFLYAKWVEGTVTVTFISNGEIYTTDEINYGTLLSRPQDPTRERYGFLGWFTNESLSTEWDFERPVKSNLTLYAGWEQLVFEVRYHYNNGDEETLEDVDKGERASERAVTKNGFSFAGWFYDSAFNNEFDFDTQINKDYDLYAKWEINHVTDYAVYYRASAMTYSWIMLQASFSHELIGTDGFNYNYSCVIDGENVDLIAVNESYGIYKIKLTKAGNFDGKLNLAIWFEDEYGTYQTSSEFALSFNVEERALGFDADSIEYVGNGTWRWNDADLDVSDITYVVEIVKIPRNSNALAFATSGAVATLSFHPGDTLAFSVYDLVEESGSYYVSIEKLFAGEVYGSAESDAFDMYKLSYDVSFESLKQNYESIYLVAGDALVRPSTDPDMSGYNFTGWYLDKINSTSCDFSKAIEADTTIYAGWMFGTMTITMSQDINETYSYGENHMVEVSVTHSSGGSNFQYTWFKDGEKIEGETNNTLTVSTVADSGVYYCMATITDAYGISATQESSPVRVVIGKASTSLIFSDVEYTYSGSRQYIGGFASLDREDERKTIYYFNEDGSYASFVNVPTGGYLNVRVFVEESDNYEGANETVLVKINKKQSEINADSFQVLTYTGSNLKLNYELNNDEQTVSYDKEIIDAKVYESVTITTKESQNFTSAQAVVSVLVKPKEITIKAKDISSLWLLGQSDYKYEILSDFDGDVKDLGVSFNCDVNTDLVGSYKIHISLENANYLASTIDGVYTVYATPYVIVTLVVVFLLALLIFMRSRLTYSVDFAVNGGEILKPIETGLKSRIDIPTPKRDGYEFVGWYTDQSLTKPFRKRYKKGATTLLYAKWKKLDEEIYAPKRPVVERANEIVSKVDLSGVLGDVERVSNTNDEKLNEIMARAKAASKKKPEVKQEKKIEPKSFDEMDEKEKTEYLLSKAASDNISVGDLDIDQIMANIKER